MSAGGQINWDSVAPRANAGAAAGGVNWDTVAPKANPTQTRPDTSGSMALDFMQGGGAELIGTALGAYNLLRKIPGADKVLPAVSPEVQQYAEPPHTVSAKIGGLLTGLAEFVIPGSEVGTATKGASLAARALAQAATAGGVEAARTSGDVNKTIDAAALGAAGPLVGAGIQAALPVIRNAPAAAFDAARFLIHPTPASALRIGQRIAGAAGSVAEEAAPAVDPLLDKLAQGFGVKDFSSLNESGQATVRNLAARMTGGQAAAAPTAPSAYVPRPPEYYGVKPAETPPTPTTQPIETPPQKPAEIPQKPEIPFEAVRKTGPQDALEGVGGGVGLGFTVYKVPTGKLIPTEDISGMPEKMADVAKYAEKLKAGSEPPALFGHYDPDTGNVVITSGSRRMMAAQQAGAPDVPVAIPKAAAGAEETLGVKPEPPQPKPASGAVKANAQAKADRFVQAIRRFNSDNPALALSSDELAAAGDQEKSMLTRGLQQGGYIKNTETFTDTSFPYILQKLKEAETAARQTIKPPPGFSMGAMKQFPPEAASPAPSAIDSKAAIPQNVEVNQATNLRQALKGDVRHATAGEINKALDKIDQMDRQTTEDFIKAGRGNERPSDYANKTDPLSMRQNDLYRQRMTLRNEIERRYGPGAPNRLPKGFGPLRS